MDTPGKNPNASKVAAAAYGFPYEEKVFLKWATADLKPGSITDFDLFTKVNDAWFLYSGAGYFWRQSEIDRLVKYGITTLYYITVQQRNVDTYLVLSKIEFGLKSIKDKSPEIKMQTLFAKACEMTSLLFSFPISIGFYLHAKQMMADLTEVLLEEPKSIQLLRDLNLGKNYFYEHGFKVAASSIAIAMRLSLKDPGHLQQIGLGAILHDLGQVHLGLEMLSKATKLDPEEGKRMIKHPDIALTDLEPFHIDFIVSQIVHNHHERLDGSGYPHALQKNEILDEVKVVAIADIYDALVSSRPFQDKVSHSQAVAAMRAKYMKGLDQEMVRVAAEVLI